jgi:hypothetical protein
MTQRQPDAIPADPQVKLMLGQIYRELGTDAYHTIDLYRLFSTARIAAGARSALLLTMMNLGYVLDQGEGVLCLTTKGINAAIAPVA